MKSFVRVFTAAFLGTSVAVLLATTQLSDAKAAKSLEIMTKARQIDLLNHMLPLLMTKEQVGKLLVVVEKGRAKVEQIKLLEHNDMLAYESKINDAINKGLQKDEVPTRKLMGDLSKLFNAFTIRRQIAATENAEMVLEVMKKEFNAGQLKSAANSHDHKIYDPKLDTSKLTEDDKLKFYIKDVLLDPACYDLLLKMTKASS